MYRGQKREDAGSSRSSEKYLMNDPRYLEGLMTQTQVPNVAKELVHPGKGNPSELLMRINLKDERMLNAVVLYYGLCEEFDLEEEKRLLAYRLAGTTSIGGIARRELIMAATGIIAPSLYESVDKKKHGRRDGKEEEKEEK